MADSPRRPSVRTYPWGFTRREYGRYKQACLHLLGDHLSSMRSSYRSRMKARRRRG